MNYVWIVEGRFMEDKETSMSERITPEQVREWAEVSAAAGDDFDAHDLLVLSDQMSADEQRMAGLESELRLEHEQGDDLAAERTSLKARVTELEQALSECEDYLHFLLLVPEDRAAWVIAGKNDLLVELHGHVKSLLARSAAPEATR